MFPINEEYLVNNSRPSDLCRGKYSNHSILSSNTFIFIGQQLRNTGKPDINFFLISVHGIGNKQKATTQGMPRNHNNYLYKLALVSYLTRSSSDLKTTCCVTKVYFITMVSASSVTTGHLIIDTGWEPPFFFSSKYPNDLTDWFSQCEFILGLYNKPNTSILVIISTSPKLLNSSVAP